MRDVKNKICNQLDLLGLIEDDCGDLSIAQVYEQVWKKSSNQSTNAVAAMLLSSNVATLARDSPPMTVTYRLQGLDGEATERMIKELDKDREEGPRSRSGVCYRKCSLGMYQARNSFGDCLGATGGCSESLNALLQNTRKREGIVEAWSFNLTMEANKSDNINIAHNALTVSNEEAGIGEQAKKIVVIRPQKVKQTTKKHRDDSMKTSSCRERLMDIILENGITEVAVRHLKDSFVFTGEAGYKSTPEWHSGLKLPSVPLTLSMLRGITKQQATSYTSEAIYKTCSSEKAEPLGCSSLNSLYLNCPNLSELNLNSCKALLPDVVVQAVQTQVSNDPVPSEDNYSHKRMVDSSKRVGIPFSFSQPIIYQTHIDLTGAKMSGLSLDDGKGTFRKRRYNGIIRNTDLSDYAYAIEDNSIHHECQYRYDFSETDYSMNFNDILSTCHVGECNHCVEELDKDFINETNEENKKESSQEEMI
ncbi:auxin transport protein BIG [Tanacetum coccineum]